MPALPSPQHTHALTHTNTCIHTHAHTHTRTHTHTHTHSHTHIHTHTRTQTLARTSSQVLGKVQQEQAAFGPHIQALEAAVQAADAEHGSLTQKALEGGHAKERAKQVGGVSRGGVQRVKHARA